MNPESLHPHENPATPPLEKHELDPEHAIAEQVTLMHRMVPKEITPYLEESDGEHIGIEDALFERWQQKYSALFRDMYDGLDLSKEKDRELAAHMLEGSLTDKEYRTIETYLTNPAHANLDEGIGGLFFTDYEKDPKEIDEFLKLYRH